MRPYLSSPLLQPQLLQTQVKESDVEEALFREQLEDLFFASLWGDVFLAPGCHAFHAGPQGSA